MHLALWILATLLAVVGLAGVLVPGLPGPPLVYGAVVVLAAAYRFERISIPLLVVLGIVTLALLVVDILATAYGARRFGGTWRGGVGAALGALIGLAGGPGILVLGALAGAIVGETIGGKDTRESMKAGVGAVLGLFAGAVVKLAACFGMIVAALLAHFFWNAT